MTSKFAPLAKLKKEQLDKTRRMLLEVNNLIRTLETALAQAQVDLSNQTTPLSGTFALLHQHTALIQACHDQIIKKKDDIYYAKQEAYKVQELVKEALIEFEKFNYLQVEEEKAHKKKMDKAEALQLDEVAIMGYNLQKEKF